MENLRTMNLHLFDANVQTTLTNNTGNSLRPEMKTFYDTALIEMAGPELVHAQFAKKVPLPKGKGKNVEWRKWTHFPKATTPLTEGVTPNGNNLNITTIEKQVSQYGDYTTLSDFLEMTAIDNVILETTSLHGKNAGLTLDTICRNEIVAGTNVRYAPKVVSGAATEVTSRADLDTTALLTPDLVAKAAADLKGNNAPKIDGYYVAIIHPYVAYDLMRHEEWIDAAHYAGSTQLFEGEIGKLYGVRFVETTEAKVWKDDTCPKDTAVFATLFIGKEPYGDIDLQGGGLEVIVKQKGSAGSADPLDQRSTIGWKATYATKILIPEYIVRVETCSAYSQTAEAN